MGRQQHLERLALGRSPFQDVEEDASSSTPEYQVQPSAGNDHQGQAYTAKGRPTNPHTESRNAAERKAQNTILELVGVVESKDAADKAEDPQTPVRKNWDEILTAEDDRGESLQFFTDLLHGIVTWWPEALVARVQAGIYADDTRFATFWDIIQSEIGMLRGRGLAGALDVLLPGILPHAVCYIVTSLSCSILTEQIGQIELHLSKTFTRQGALKWLHRTASLFTEALHTTVDALLLPLQFHAETQRLALAPAHPLFPPWRSIHPFTPTSTHQHLWTSPSALPFLGSAGFWLILQQAHTTHDPLTTQLTTWEPPSISQPHPTTIPRPLKDPLGYILSTTYRLRARLLHLAGWTIPSLPRPSDDSPASTPRQDSPSEAKIHHHRSTALATALPTFLASRIDALLQKVLLLPFESLVIRCVSRAYTSAHPGARVGYTPFGGGPLGSLLRGWGSGRGLRRYLSQLGLSLAVYCSVEVGVFFVVYGLSRWQGVRYFEWRELEKGEPGDGTVAGVEEREMETERVED